MARGSSQSQASARAGPGARAPRAGPRGTPGAAGVRRRSAAASGDGAAGFVGGGGGSNMLRFYTDDAPGIKISPTAVLVMSLCFIGFVTALHVFGKFYRHRSSSSSSSSSSE